MSDDAGYKLAAAGILLAAFGAVSLYQSSATGETVTLTVRDKERIVTGSGDSTSSKYIVYAEGETFENTDSMFDGKFNSSDLQGGLERGHTYKCRVNGWRNPFFSMHRNIISCTEMPVQRLPGALPR